MFISKKEKKRVYVAFAVLSLRYRKLFNLFVKKQKTPIQVPKELNKNVDAFYGSVHLFLLHTRMFLYLKDFMAVKNVSWNKHSY